MPEPAAWRDDAPRPVREDVDALAQAGFDAAEHLLERRRDFAPFAVAVAGDGRHSLVESDPGPGPGPTSQVLLEGLVASVRQDRGRYRAVGFVALVFTRTGDAVRVELEHRDGGPALVLLRPCRPSRLRRRVWTGPVDESTGSRLVWDRS
jgi:hypothetical protein